MTREVTFTCKGCGARVRTFRFINYRTIPPTVDESDLCSRCKEGEERAMTDRKQLEEAIGFYRHAHWLSNGQNDRLLPLIEAAEAHLASLPKPQWRVRLHRGNTFELYTHETPEAAIANVAAAVGKGTYDKIEIEHPSSVSTETHGERVCAWAEVRDGQVLGFHTIKMRPVEGAEMVELVGYTKAKGAK